VHLILWQTSLDTTGVDEPSNVPELVRPDSDLLRGAIEGDVASFAGFCIRSLPTVLRYLSHMCRTLSIPVSLAEDAAQEAFLRATEWRCKHPESNLSLGWMIRVGQNALRDWARHGRRSISLADLDWLLSAPLPASELDTDLWQALERLSTTDRTLLEMILIEELEFSDVARRLGINLMAVYKRYQRAMNRLRQLMPDPLADR